MFIWCRGGLGVANACGGVKWVVAAPSGRRGWPPIVAEGATIVTGGAAARMRGWSVTDEGCVCPRPAPCSLWWPLWQPSPPPPPHIGHPSLVSILSYFHTFIAYTVPTIHRVSSGSLFRSAVRQPSILPNLELATYINKKISKRVL